MVHDLWPERRIRLVPQAASGRDPWLPDAIEKQIVAVVTEGCTGNTEPYILDAHDSIRVLAVLCMYAQEGGQLSLRVTYERALDGPCIRLRAVANGYVPFDAFPGARAAACLDKVKQRLIEVLGTQVRSGG